MSDILHRLSQYNPPDRTLDTERRIAQDIWDAKERIAELEREIERMRPVVEAAADVEVALRFGAPLSTVQVMRLIRAMQKHDEEGK